MLLLLRVLFCFNTVFSVLGMQEKLCDLTGVPKDQLILITTDGEHLTVPATVSPVLSASMGQQHVISNVDSVYLFDRRIMKQEKLINVLELEIMEGRVPPSYTTITSFTNSSIGLC